MGYTFSDEDKVADEFTERLPFGVSKVKIEGFATGETESGSQYIQVSVEAGGVKEDVRVWFSEKSAKYSFATLRQIAVHNANAEAKEKARMAVEGVKDDEGLCELLNKNCIGGEAWVEKYYDPVRTYESNGSIYRSIKTNLRGYEPKLKPELLEKRTDEQIDAASDAVTDAFPGATAEPSSTIPSDNAWNAAK